MTISPNFGEIGAPQLGHFNDAAPDGAKIGRFDVETGTGLESPLFKPAPHFIQNAASSGS
jgi:hypothetical protein